jgi:hypothetical protein
MPYELQVLPEAGVAFFRFVGQVNAREGMEAFLLYTEHSSFSPEHVMLTDARGVTSIDASFIEVLSICLSLRAQLGKFDKEVLSVVLVGTEHQFGFARMLEQVLNLLSNIRLHVVNGVDEALNLTSLGPEWVSRLTSA